MAAMAGLSLVVVLVWSLGSGTVRAQSVAKSVPDKSAPQAAPQAVPGFWDPRRRPDRPDLSRLTVIRFLTETDYPPFNFVGTDGNPAGFNVDLARAICAELTIPCTIQARPWADLAGALANKNADAIIAGLAIALISVYLAALGTGQKFDRGLRHSHPTTSTSDVPIEPDE